MYSLRVILSTATQWNGEIFEPSKPITRILGFARNDESVMNVLKEVLSYKYLNFQ